MSDEPECIHGLGPVSACTICNGREKRERQQVTVTGYFPAKYASRLSCGHVAVIGEMLCRLSDESLLCEECHP